MRVLVVEDSKLISERLIAMLTALPGVHVVGQTGSVREAIVLIKQRQPDVVVLDLQLEDGNGIDVLRAVTRDLPQVAVIVLTNYADDYHRELCLQAGARDFLDKSFDIFRIPQVLSRLRNGADCVN